MSKKIISEAIEALNSYNKNVSTSENAEKETTKEKPKHTRTRKFSCVTYIPTEPLEKYLRTSPWVQHWAYAHHDCDVWTEDDEALNNNHKAGTSKTPHTHVILYTYEAKSSSAIKKNFDNLAKIVDTENPQNTQVQVCNDCGAQFRYLCHEDDIDKYQYQKQVRKADDFPYWERLSATDGLTDVKTNTGLAMVNDFLAGTSARLMCERYGKEWIYHAGHIRSMALSIQREENQGYIDFDREMVKMLLESSPFYEIDKIKFFEIFDYIGKVISNDFGQKPIINFYLGGADKK